MSQRRTALLFLVAVAAAYSSFAWIMARSSSVIWLRDGDDARWIIENEVPRLTMLIGEDGAVFRYRFVLHEEPKNATLQVKAFRNARIDLNHQVLRDFSEKYPSEWYGEFDVDLTESLQQGQNELLLFVKNERAEAAVWARCPELAIYTGREGWDSQQNQAAWLPARLAARPPAAVFEAPAPDAPTGFWKGSPVYLIVFVTGVVLARRYRWSDVDAESPGRWLTPERFRFGVMLLLLILGVNNMFRLSLFVGMDALDHYMYAHYVAEHHSLPVPDSTNNYSFRAPLVYIIGAVFYSLFSASFSQDMADMLTRILPISLGIGIVEIMYRAMKRVYPNNPRFVMVGTALGGLLPINVYMSQTFGNEIMAGFTGGLVVLTAIYFLTKESLLVPRDFVFAGALLGLALLSKVSTFLLVVPTFLAVIACCLRQGDSGKRIGREIFIGGASCFAIAGWYFLRNWVVAGSPVLASWDVNEFQWWQFPGYRMPINYLRFGDGFWQPLYAGIFGFWDGLYATMWLDSWRSGTLGMAPGWNSHPLVAAAWLGVFPSGLLVVGAVAPFRKMIACSDAPCTAAQRVHVFALGCIAVYLLAILNLHLTIPNFGHVKASYMLAIAPCLALVLVRGFVALEQLLPRSLRPVLYGFLGSWLVCVYWAYFSVLPLRL